MFFFLYIRVVDVRLATSTKEKVENTLGLALKDHLVCCSRRGDGSRPIFSRDRAVLALPVERARVRRRR